MSFTRKVKTGLVVAAAAAGVLGGAGLAQAAAAPDAQIGTAASPAVARDSAPAAAVRQGIVASRAESGVVSAAAAGGWYRCPSGYLCLFSDRDGGGHMAYFRSGSPNLAVQGANNNTSSQWNRAAYSFNLYNQINYVDWRSSIPSGGWWNLDWYHGEDMWSSVRRS